MTTTRENILKRVRQSLQRPGGGEPQSVPPVRLNDDTRGDRVERFRKAVEALAGKTCVVADAAEAGEYVKSVVAGRLAVSSDAPLLKQCGIAFAPGVLSDAAVGVTSAEYGLADTGSLVVMSASEARLVSLLPPVHVAVIRAEQILAGLDELLTREPLPAERTASMVLITGPSRTADIEQILIRGVHGPGELHVVIIK